MSHHTCQVETYKCHKVANSQVPTSDNVIQETVKCLTYPPKSSSHWRTKYWTSIYQYTSVTIQWGSHTKGMSYSLFSLGHKWKGWWCWVRKILSRHKQKQSHNSESRQLVVLDQRRGDEGRWKGGLGRGDKNFKGCVAENIFAYNLL